MMTKGSIRLPVWIDDVEIYTEFHVVNELQEDAIVSVNFLKEFDLQIDWTTNELKRSERISSISSVIDENAEYEKYTGQYLQKRRRIRMRQFQVGEMVLVRDENRMSNLDPYYIGSS